MRSATAPWARGLLQSAQDFSDLSVVVVDLRQSQGGFLPDVRVQRFQKVDELLPGGNHVVQLPQSAGQRNEDRGARGLLEDPLEYREARVRIAALAEDLDCSYPHFLRICGGCELREAREGAVEHIFVLRQGYDHLGAGKSTLLSCLCYLDAQRRHRFLSKGLELGDCCPVRGPLPLLDVPQDALDCRADARLFSDLSLQMRSLKNETPQGEKKK